ncbi:uncharacterized protein LOC107785192 isoform X2 [Nicotiana tabacum]|uniref:Uncharacterized protein LOC107785192 isoform X2 n=1 Tax=Nicotiana tabacum TaxID=4097 RepID=A0A1S3ZBZ2_TOBAC|nr:PREDICTED: uncharacterized protein LOC107785192 isoform X2 [Nicotiana tabacum]
MGKKGSRKKGGGTTSGSVTLREELSGKEKQNHVNAKSMLKLEHIKNLATWVSGETPIHSLGAFFGQRLAASAESLGVPPDPSLFSCQRCESILQSGYNCSLWIEKNKRKGQNRLKKPGIPPKNYVVYECHFCSHRNLKRGTPSGYMNDLYPVKTTTSRVYPTKSATRKSEQLDTVVSSIDKARVAPTESAMQKSEQLDTLLANIDETRVDLTESATQKFEQFDTSVDSANRVNNADVMVSSEIVGDDPTAGPATPLSTVTVTSLLDSKRKKRNRTGSKKKVEPQDGSSATDAEETVPTSSKRKRKSWTSLKEIAESKESFGATVKLSPRDI